MKAQESFSRSLNLFIDTQLDGEEVLPQHVYSGSCPLLTGGYELLAAHQPGQESSNFSKAGKHLPGMLSVSPA